MGRNIHLVIEVVARMNMDENIIAIPLRRNVHAMKMQIAWITGQSVPETDSQDVARARSEQWWQVGAVVQGPWECEARKLDRARRSGQHRIENAIPASDVLGLC